MKNFNAHELIDIIKIPDSSWLKKQRYAGEVVAQTLVLLEKTVKTKTNLTLKQLSKLAYEFIISKNCSSTFFNYKGFPGEICISVNNCLVHGVPTDYILQDGDIVKFDLGATFEGAIADSAISLIYGEPKNNLQVKMLETNKIALENSIKYCKPHTRFGMIGNIINKTITNNGFTTFNEFGGHGIYWNTPHSSPYIFNKSSQDIGARMQVGMTFAIEPLILPLGSSTNFKISDDKWSVFTQESGAHHEHTIFIHEDYTEIITDRTKFYD